MCVCVCVCVYIYKTLCKLDLNQIPYSYTVEVTNRFKGLDLIECLKNCGQSVVTLNRRQ